MTTSYGYMRIKIKDKTGWVRTWGDYICSTEILRLAHRGNMETRRISRLLKHRTSCKSYVGKVWIPFKDVTLLYTELKITPTSLVLHPEPVLAPTLSVLRPGSEQPPNFNKKKEEAFVKKEEEERQEDYLSTPGFFKITAENKHTWCRESDLWLNATRIVKAAGVSRLTHSIHTKTRQRFGGNLPHSGTYVPLSSGLALCEQYHQLALKAAILIAFQERSVRLPMYGIDANEEQAHQQVDLISTKTMDATETEGDAPFPQEDLISTKRADAIETEGEGKYPQEDPISTEVVSEDVIKPELCGCSICAWKM